MIKHQKWRYTEDLSIFDGFVSGNESSTHLIARCNLADVRSYAGTSRGINGRKIVLDFL